MIEILTAINKILDIKLVQWLLLCALTSLIVIIITFWFKLNTIRLENAFLQVESTKLNNGLRVQNEKVKELGEVAKKYQDYYVLSTKKAQEVQASTAKSLKALSEYTFEGDCQQNIRTAIELVKKGTQ